MTDPAIPDTDAANATVLDDRWRIFLRVAEVGSLSKAAAVMGQPQSMVSRAISHLERSCGERLFVRTGRGVVVTAFGARLLPRVARLAAEADALVEDIRAARGTPMGDVIVGLLPSAAKRFAGPLAARVRAEMPGVRLHLVESASAQLEEHLRDGRLDMAVVLREDESSVGDGQVLAQVSLYLIGCDDRAPLDKPTVPLRALSGLPLVLPARPHLLRARLDRMAAEYGLELSVAVEADSVQLQYAVAAAGAGLAIVSVAAGMPVGPLRASRIVEPELVRYVVLAESVRRPGTSASREVHRLLCDLGKAS